MTKRLLAAVLCALLAFAPLAVARAADMQEEMLDFLVQELELERNSIQLGEARELTLDRTGVKLVINYFTYEDNGDFRKGEIAWHVKENRFILDQDIWDLYVEERELEQEYYQGLAKEAGKIDVWLFGQLKAMQAGEEISVVLIPAFILSSELEQAIRNLYLEYDLEAPEHLGPYWWGVWAHDEASPPPLDYDEGQTEPGSSGGGSSGSGSIPPSSGGDGQDPDDTVSSEPSPGKDPSDDGENSSDIDDIREPYPMPMPEPDPRMEEFYGKLEQLWLQGYQASLANLETVLTAQGIQYQIEGAVILITATVADVIQLKDHANVDLITWAISIDDSAELAPTDSKATRLPQMGLATGERLADFDSSIREGGPSPSSSDWLPGTLILAGLLAVGGGAWVVTKRKKAS